MSPTHTHTHSPRLISVFRLRSLLLKSALFGRLKWSIEVIISTEIFKFPEPSVDAPFIPFNNYDQFLQSKPLRFKNINFWWKQFFFLNYLKSCGSLLLHCITLPFISRGLSDVTVCEVIMLPPSPLSPLPSPLSPLLLSPVVCLLRSSPDVTGARNNGEVRRLYEPVPHGERRREYDAVTLPPTLPFSLHHHHRTHWRPDTFSCVPGASHGRGLPEDPQRGGEEEEEGGEEERNQEGPSHLTITHRAIARYRCASAEEKDVEEGKE